MHTHTYVELHNNMTQRSKVN